MKKLTFMVILLLIPLVYSFNFGTVPKNNYKLIKQGESTQFTILLWNLGESSYPVSVELKTELPRWDIIVRPQNFVLKPTPVVTPPYDDGEYIQIPGKGSVKAETLRIFVKTPNNVNIGKYDLILVAKAGNLQDQLSIFQEREFRLSLKIEEKPSIFEKTYGALKLTGEKIVEQSNNMKDNITGMITTAHFNQLVIFIIGLIIIIGAIVVVFFKYKK